MLLPAVLAGLALCWLLDQHKVPGMKAATGTLVLLALGLSVHSLIQGPPRTRPTDTDPDEALGRYFGELIRDRAEGPVLVVQHALFPPGHVTTRAQLAGLRKGLGGSKHTLRTMAWRGGGGESLEPADAGGEPARLRKEAEGAVAVVAFTDILDALRAEDYQALPPVYAYAGHERPGLKSLLDAGELGCLVLPGIQSAETHQPEPIRDPEAWLERRFRILKPGSGTPRSR